MCISYLLFRTEKENWKMLIKVKVLFYFLEFKKLYMMLYLQFVYWIFLWIISYLFVFFFQLQTLTGKEVSSKSKWAIAINNSKNILQLPLVKYIIMINIFKKPVYVLLITEFMILLDKRKSGLSLGCLSWAANRAHHIYENWYKLRFRFNLAQNKS